MTVMFAESAAGDRVFDLSARWRAADQDNLAALKAYSEAVEQLAEERDAPRVRRSDLMTDVARRERSADELHERVAELTQAILLETPSSPAAAARILEVVRQEYCDEPEMALARFALKNVIDMLDRTAR